MMIGVAVLKVSGFKDWYVDKIQKNYYEYWVLQ